jgi:hypothetical protein
MDARRDTAVMPCGPKADITSGPVTYRQDQKDILHDCAERLQGVDVGMVDAPAEGFYPQYLRSDLITALREFFYQKEQNRSGPTAYDRFAAHEIERDSLVITLNYDVALERALAKAGKWDVGTGYGFTAFALLRKIQVQVDFAFQVIVGGRRKSRVQAARKQRQCEL